MTTEELIEKKRKESETLSAKKKKLDAQIRELAQKDAKQKRKEREHMLIVLGATVCKIFDRDYLTKPEIEAVARFLFYRVRHGDFSLASAAENQEQTQNAENA